MAPTLDTMPRNTAPAHAKPAALAAPASVVAPHTAAEPAGETTARADAVPARPGQVLTISDVRDVAALLAARPKAQAGCRSLLTGETTSCDAADMALDLTRNLAKLGAQVVLIDWDLDGAALAAKFGGQAGPGLHESARRRSVIRGRHPATCATQRPMSSPAARTSSIHRPRSIPTVPISCSMRSMRPMTTSSSRPVMREPANCFLPPRGVSILASSQSPHSKADPT